MKILVLGATGMIGSAMFRSLSAKTDWTVTGTTRRIHVKRPSLNTPFSSTLTGIDLLVQDDLVRLFRDLVPDVVINCAGVTKHVLEGSDPKRVIEMNALFPHRLAEMCRLSGTRLVHISTDCVFAGTRGNYCEDSIPDALDLYGRSKILGEVTANGAVTIRTSTIGHEVIGKFGLLEWFLSQRNQCKGYRRAIFSGLPTFELARVVRDFIIPNLDLSGLYHVGGNPIDKFSLLGLIAKQYKKPITIDPDDTVVIDRTLDSSRFSLATGYLSSSWPELIKKMKVENQEESYV